MDSVGIIVVLVLVAWLMGGVAFAWVTRRTWRTHSALPPDAPRFERLERHVLQVQDAIHQLDRELSIHKLQLDEHVSHLQGSLSRLTETLTSRLPSPDSAVSANKPRLSEFEEYSRALDATSTLEGPKDLPVLKWFLLEADQRPVSWGEIVERASASGSRAYLISGSEDDPKVIAFAGSNASWSATPMLRVPMSTANLSFFELQAHSGIDPIRARQLTRPARLARSNDGWIAVEKGVINGAE